MISVTQKKNINSISRFYLLKHDIALKYFSHKFI